MATRGFVAIAWRASSCHFWGLALRHVVTNSTGSLRRARRVSDISLIIFFRLWVVERATTPRGGHGSLKEGTMKTRYDTKTQCADLGGCESMWGYTNTQMPAHIFAWGGVSVHYKIAAKICFLGTICCGFFVDNF